MSVSTVFNKINNLLIQIKHCLKQGQFQLPLIRCDWTFDFDKKTQVRTQGQTIVFRKNNISIVLRIVEILFIVRELISNNKYITKRNLYYQLVKYYSYYSILDSDLLVICDSLKLQRSALNIIVSSKLQIFWFPIMKVHEHNQYHLKNHSQKVAIQLMYKKGIFMSYFQSANLNNRINPIQLHLNLQPYQIFKIPNCPKLNVNIIYPQNTFKQSETINFLIMEKQSLFQILSESLNYKPPTNKSNWLLVNSKGYADMTAFRFINEVLKIGQKTKNIQFFYIGDYDVYGIDIMLNYAIEGNQTFKGLWTQLKWLCKFEDLIDFQESNNNSFSKQKFQKAEYRKQTPEDKKKIKQILERQYLQVSKLKQMSENKLKGQMIKDNDELFLQKADKWRNVLQNLLENDYQCQVESYFKNILHPFEVIEIMIEQKFYI